MSGRFSRLFVRLGLVVSYYKRTVPPNEIVPRQGPPSVNYEESDRKVNQRMGPSLKTIKSYFKKVSPRLKMTYMLMLLRRGPLISLYVDDFKAWAPFLRYKLMILRRGLPITL